MAGDLSSRIDDLVRELAQFHGHRTVWIDLHGGLVHAEPDDELEARGFLYVATLMRPGADELREALARHLSLSAEPRPEPGIWSGPEVGLAGLAPA